jgi:hypothetical protein
MNNRKKMLHDLRESWEMDFKSREVRGMKKWNALSAGLLILNLLAIAAGVAVLVTWILTK